MKILVEKQLIEYRDDGSGDVILLLHGWGTNHTTFDHLAAYLAKNYRVIRFDFPGFGQSARPIGDWHVEDYARLTEKLLEKLKVDKVYVAIGHSFGGRVIIKAAGSDKIKPGKIVLIGSAGVKPQIEFKKAVFKSVAKIGKVITSAPVVRRLQPLLKKRLYKAAGSTDYLNANEMQPIFLNVINEDLLADAAKITQPTLLIWGRDDTETPLSDAEKMNETIKNSQLVVIPKAGHFVYLEVADKVESEIGKFL